MNGEPKASRVGGVQNGDAKKSSTSLRRKSSNASSSSSGSGKRGGKRTRSSSPRLPAGPPGILERATTFFIDNQITLSLSVLGAIHAAHLALPNSPQNPSITHKLTTLNYYNPVSGKYGKGGADYYLVFYWIVWFTLLRDAFMRYVFIPYARWGGVKTQKDLTRFAEQAWLMVYYIFFWSLGMYLNYNSPYWMNLRALWMEWPFLEISGLFKWYYLAQLAFWLQQIFVLHIEERRKDHYQMFAHHIITSCLIVGSYMYHQTPVGNDILCTMDIVDILLPAAKLLRYLGYQKLCDIAFGIFLVAWVVSRHVVYIFILYSVYAHLPEYIDFRCENIYTGEHSPASAHNLWQTHFLGADSDYTCFTRGMQMTFLSLLVALQFLTLIWLYMIGKIAYKVITGSAAEDTRSDDEDDGEDEEEEDVEDEDGNEKVLDAEKESGKDADVDLQGEMKGLLGKTTAVAGGGKNKGSGVHARIGGAAVASSRHMGAKPLGSEGGL